MLSHTIGGFVTAARRLREPWEDQVHPRQGTQSLHLAHGPVDRPVGLCDKVQYSEKGALPSVDGSAPFSSLALDSVA